jgi:hypothetical protein
MFILLLASFSFCVYLMKSLPFPLSSHNTSFFISVGSFYLYEELCGFMNGQKRTDRREEERSNNIFVVSSSLCRMI